MKSTNEVPAKTELEELMTRAKGITAKTPSHEQVKKDLGPIVTLLRDEKRLSFQEVAEWFREESSTKLNRSASYYSAIYSNWKALLSQQGTSSPSV